jgi:sphingolipid 4-desaturase/C4-monooxygenase
MPIVIDEDDRSPRPSDFHRQRRAAILAQRPEVKQVFGHCPGVAWITAALAAVQVGLAIVMADAPWYAALLAAAFIGAFISHCLNVVIHEACHNLVLRTTGRNKAVAILANLPALVPTAIGFRYYHLLHHRFLGEERLDGDVCLAWEKRVFTPTPVRKFLWLLLLPIFYGIIHPLQVRERLPLDRWAVANVVVVSGFAIGVMSILGWTSLLYLGLSTYLSVGPHPTGAHIVQEHVNYGGYSYVNASYYGPINAISLNHGYHLEHHDFANVPGPWLPKLRQLAPEFYAGRFTHRSRLLSLWQFIFDPRLGIDSRRTSTEGEIAAAPARPVSTTA